MLPEVSQHLFARWRAGETEAINDLLPLIYDESRQVARKHLRGQRADHTFQTAALIHEAYLRLVDGVRVKVQDHVHLVALASRILRQILVDHARARLATEQQGRFRVTLSEAATVKSDWTMARTWLRSELRSSAP